MMKNFHILLLVCSFIGIFFKNVESTSCTKSYQEVQEKLLQRPIDFVNVLSGTNSRYDMSYGCTLPLMTRPWGFNSYAPQTDNDPTWPGFWFHPSDKRFFGLRVTHQPSPWIGDYGQFLIKPYMPSDLNDVTKDLFTGYSSSKATFTPYYFATNFFSYGNSKGKMKIEMSPTNHGGIMKVTYPPYISHEEGDGEVSGPFTQIRRISIVLNGKPDFAEVTSSPIDGTVLISGYSKKNNGGVGVAAAGFAHYFAIAIYCGQDGTQITTLEELNSVFTSETNNWVEFDPKFTKNQIITLRFATSFISKEQALYNLQLEVPTTKDFETMKSEAFHDWETVFNRIKVQDGGDGYTPCELEDMYTIFYTSLYRASLYPRQLSEQSRENNELIHWSPYVTSADQRVQPGYLSSDSGFWDAWNSVYPLLSLMNRPMLGVMMNGWLNSYKEGGWLPKWSSPGYRTSMIGTMGDVSIADAIVKQIPGFDVSLAYEAIRKDAFEIPPVGVDGIGRVCLEDYLKYGYIPRGANMTTGGQCYDVISRSLNYLQSDYAVAQAAQFLQQENDYTILSERSKNYWKIFDNETSFFRARVINSEDWILPFDQYGWGYDYTEGGPWQYRFYVPYDVNGLRNLYNSLPKAEKKMKDLSNRIDSSDDFMCSVLKEVQTTETVFHVGGNDVEIKEMTELADNCWGQYSHNDQPVHHLLYMHMYDGYDSYCSNQGRHYLRETLLKLYHPTNDMYAGDEDNGEMAAWYILSSLGLYARSPGSLEYIFGSPLFSKVELDISDNNINNKSSLPTMESKKLVIIAHDNRPGNSAVKKIVWNGQEVDRNVNGISYLELAKGGVLEFYMTRDPLA